MDQHLLNMSPNDQHYPDVQLCTHITVDISILCTYTTLYDNIFKLNDQMTHITQ